MLCSVAAELLYSNGSNMFSIGSWPKHWPGNLEPSVVVMASYCTQRMRRNAVVLDLHGVTHGYFI